MANAKIINYGQPIGAGSTAIPDNTSVALDIESTDAKDYITINTTDDSEDITIKGGGDSLVSVYDKGVTITGYGGTTGGSPSDAEDVVLYIENGDANSTNACVAELNTDGSSGSQLRFKESDTLKGWIGAISGHVYLNTNSAAGDLIFRGNNAERMRIDAETGVTKITGPGGTTGLAPSTGGDAPTLYLENSTGSSKDRTTLLMNADGNSGSNIDMYHADNLCLRIAANSTEQSITAEDELILRAEATDAAMFSVSAASTFSTGAVGTALTSGTVSTSGSSTTLTGSSTVFTTDFHVGAAIKVGTVTTTVTQIDSNTQLILEDAIETGVTGTTCKRDSGELFAVKTGDGKSVLAVNSTGVLTLSTSSGVTSSTSNIAIGDAGLLDAIEEDGVLNTIIAQRASGSWALSSAANNVIIGFGSGLDMTNAQRNVAIGTYALDDAASTQNSVAIGTNCGRKSGNDCVYIGHNAGDAATGVSNTAIGKNALTAAGAAAKCVALGHDSLALATGSQNCGLGFESGKAIEDGTGNLCLGYQSNTGASQVKSIAIGYQVAASVNQKAYIGDGANAASLIFSASGNSWSTTSDARIKENIEDAGLGLDFINALRPVKYTEINPQDWPEEIRPHIFFDKTETRINEETGEEEEYTVPANERSPTCTDVFDGLIAQEVKAAADAAGTTFSGYDDSEPNGLIRLEYERFVVPLIKAVQELTARVAELEAGD